MNTKEKLSNTKSNKALKVIASLTLAAATVIAPLTFSACNTKQTSPDANTAQPGDETTSSGENANTYSQILQTVLTDDYYNDLIDQSIKENVAVFFSNPYFAPNPYTFLQQNGHDVDAIKDRQLECNTEMYFIGNDTNNLYMSVHAENSASTITDYVLKYSITTQEYNDLKMLFEKDYIQAPLFIQELSKQKTANVQSKITLTINAYDLTKEYFNRKSVLNILNCSLTSFDLTYLSTQTNELKINIRSISNNENVACEIRKYEGILWNYCLLNENNGIYDFDRISFSSASNEEFKNPGQTIYYLGLASGYTTNNLNRESI